MGQLDQGGFTVKQDDGQGGMKTSGYVYVEQLDLRNAVEHWILVVTPKTTETTFKVPQASASSTNIVVERSSNGWSSVAEFIDEEYKDPAAAGFKRRYIKCSCEELTL